MNLDHVSRLAFSEMWSGAAVIDARLIAGAAVLGAGLGVSGFCPGPGLTYLTFAAPDPVVFVAAMRAGMALFRPAPPARERWPAGNGLKSANRPELQG